MVNKDQKTKTYCVICSFDNMLLLHRNIGNIVYDILQKYENAEVFQLQKFERLSIKTRKAELDIKFLRNCKIFNVIPKFVNLLTIF